MSNFNKGVKDLVNDLITYLKKDMPANNIESYRNNIHNTIGLESADGINHFKNTVSNINDNIDNILTNLLSTEEYENYNKTVTDAQRKALTMISPILFNPKLYRDRVTNLEPLKTDTPNRNNTIVSVSAEELGTTHIAEPEAIQSDMAIAMESFDGQALNNFIYTNIAMNFSSPVQSPFMEAFTPLITIDPEVSGIVINLEYVSVFEEFLRNVNGNPDDFKKHPLIKKIFDSTVFGNNRFQLVPVLRKTGGEKLQNNHFFLEEAAYVTDCTGKEITTAPLKFGNNVSYIGISSTDDVLARGPFDNTDALDRSIQLDSLYFTFGGKKEIFKIDTKIFNYTRFVPVQQGHWKQMYLMFFAEIAVPLNHDKLFGTKVGELATGEAISNELDDYKEYVAIFETKVNGNTSVETSNMELTVQKFKLARVVDANNNEVLDYSKCKDMLNGATLEGYVLNAYKTNSNVRTRGVLTTLDKITYNYSVPFRSGSTNLYPVMNIGGTENDVTYLAEQVNMTGRFLDNIGIITIVDFLKSMELATTHTALAEINMKYGISQYMLNPYFYKEDFSLKDIVDSINSHTRMQDVRSALLNKIKLQLNTMTIQSNYGVANEVLNVNGPNKIGIVIGTDPMIKSILVCDQDVFELGDYEIHVVSTYHPLVRGKLIMAYSSFDANRNSTPNPLTFGFCAWSPTVSYKVTKQVNNAVVTELHNNPRFLHVINMPVVSYYEIRDVLEVCSKIPVIAYTSVLSNRH